MDVVASDVADADVRERDAIDELVARADEVDLLLSTAGVEVTAAFTSLTRAEILEMSPSPSARRSCWPRAAARDARRRRGHVVFVAPVANLAYSEPSRRPWRG
jgi:NADP-dependent 3-hydroxy acid dehydrogenase YdfG